MKQQRNLPMVLLMSLGPSGRTRMEVVLILVVLIGLVIIFKTQIRKLLETIFKQIETQSKEVY